MEFILALSQKTPLLNNYTLCLEVHHSLPVCQLAANSVGKTKRNGNLVPRSYLEISRERSGYETSEMVSAEYESDLRSNEHYLNSSENKA